MLSRHLSILAHSAEEKSLLGTQKVERLPGCKAVVYAPVPLYSTSNNLTSIIVFNIVCYSHTLTSTTWTHGISSSELCIVNTFIVSNSVIILRSILWLLHIKPITQSPVKVVIDLLDPTAYPCLQDLFQTKQQFTSKFVSKYPPHSPCSKLQSMSEAVASQKLSLAMWISSNARISPSFNFGSQACIRIYHEGNLL